MNKSTKSLLLAALVALAPAAYAQAQLTDGVPETDPALITGSTFNVDANNPVPTTFMGDTTGATISQVNVLDGGVLSSTNNNFDFTEININSGGDTENSINIQNAELNVLPGGSIGSLITVGTNSTLNVGSGVTDIGNNITVAGTANINSGTHSIAFESLQGSTVNIGGTADIDGSSNDFAGVVNISGDAQISGGTDFTTTSNATVSGGTFGSNIDFDGGASFTGGTFGSNFNINSTATGVVFDDTDGGVTIASGAELFVPVTINGGNFTASADFEVGSTGSVINGGTFGNNTDFLDGITINDGTFGTNQDVGNAFDTSSSNVNPDVTVNGGTFLELDVDSGITTINGGTFIGGSAGTALAANNNISQVTEGTINLSGGDVQGFVEALGTLNIFGTNFAIDDVLISGESIDVDEGSVLTGILEDGNEISLELNLAEFSVDADGETTIFAALNQGTDLFGGERFGSTLTAGGTSINITAVPEPSSLSLLALGALGLISRRRRS